MTPYTIAPSLVTTGYVCYSHYSMIIIKKRKMQGYLVHVLFQVQGYLVHVLFQVQKGSPTKHLPLRSQHVPMIIYTKDECFPLRLS
ncbi:Uncharacterized protein TCM_008442 [Theobroma cacao]|uniref:Uncharacterized protein n=1 Tax=Theobroma cacao TaxID=3641 RepID=A0A061E520_THECC|nr:Uncharacterized protein TCM_008442 [Theobroma cacao]